MKLYLLNEAGAGHFALDAAGLIPGIGEFADLTNAMWYIKEKKYVSAVLSLISMLPGAGDLAAKGLKYMSKGSKPATKFVAKYGDNVKQAWDKFRVIANKNGKIHTILKPHINELDRAVNELIKSSQKPANQDVS